jgi:hypothetical protein
MRPETGAKEKDILIEETFAQQAEVPTICQLFLPIDLEE